MLRSARVATFSASADASGSAVAGRIRPLPPRDLIMATIASDAALAPVVVPPAGGHTVRAFGNELLLKLTAEQTGNGLSLALAEAAPHHGPPLHVHDREDEIFIILSGTYRVVSEEGATDAGPGAVVFLPRGV